MAFLVSLQKKKKKQKNRKPAESIPPPLIYAPLLAHNHCFSINNLTLLRKRRDNLSIFKKKISPKGKESALIEIILFRKAINKISDSKLR